MFATLALLVLSPSMESQTITETVCAKLRENYTSMSKPVATLEPFETGDEFSKLTIGDESWFVEHEAGGLNPNNLWFNSNDPHVLSVDIYLHPYDLNLSKNDEDYDPNKCVVQYRRVSYRGNSLVEIGRVDVSFYVVEAAK